MPFKDPIKEKEYQKRYRELHRYSRLQYLKTYYQINKKRFTEYSKQYCKEHRLEAIKRASDYYYNNREYVKSRISKYVKNEGRDAHNMRCKKYRLKARNLCLNHYSNGKMECECCKEKIIEFLTIDHINGGGRKHRASINRHLCEWLVRNKFPIGYRILCWNCNSSIKQNGLCPHKLTKNRSNH